jgi:hypothetical protein
MLLCDDCYENVHTGVQTIHCSTPLRYSVPRVLVKKCPTRSTWLYNFLVRPTDLYISENRSVQYNGNHPFSGQRKHCTAAQTGWIACWGGGVSGDVIFREIINLQSTRLKGRRTGRAQQRSAWNSSARQCDRDISSAQSSRWSGQRLLDRCAKPNGFCSYVT